MVDSKMRSVQAFIDGIESDFRMRCTETIASLDERFQFESTDVRSFVLRGTLTEMFNRALLSMKDDLSTETITAVRRRLKVVLEDLLPPMPDLPDE